jgi:hypothetical protein
MAKVTLNPVLESIQGKVGDLVFKRWNSEEIVTKVPKRAGIEPTADQVAQQERFRLAVLYGKAVVADPQQKVIYDDAAARKGEPAFALAVGDFLNAPAVHEIDLSGYSGKSGEMIRIRASDDVEVKGVAVVIRDPQGAVIEQGNATWTTTGANWSYVTTTNLVQGQSVSIEVTATDRPGHKTTKSQPRS